MPLKPGSAEPAGRRKSPAPARPAERPAYIVRVPAGEPTAVLLASLFAEANLGIRWPASGSPARVDLFCATRAEARARRDEVRRIWPAARPVIRLAPRRDWAENWKRFFRARRVSPRIVVKPPWESAVPLPGDCVVEIDPGLSFGTGLHGTTRACLRLLDAWQQRHPGASVLDVGCGSGILAIAAAKLGCPRVTAVDNDPDALRVARANAASNGLAGRIRFRRADAARLPAGLTADLVLANLLAGLLRDSAGGLAAAVRPGPAAGLVLSGILAGQFESVRAAYAARGFSVWRTATLNGWKSALLVRQRGPAVSRSTQSW